MDVTGGNAAMDIIASVAPALEDTLYDVPPMLTVLAHPYPSSANPDVVYMVFKVGPFATGTNVQGF